ncbi:MAG: HVO_0476 family zinc finger protein [Halobacteriaceae archaeon]
MSEREGEQAAFVCPSCSPGVETVHEVLSEGGGWVTVRCTECQHVHKEQLPEAEEVERTVVVSQSGESETTTVMAPRGETIARGEEFVVETEAAVHEVRITDLQLGAEQRTEEATVEDVETIWTRAVDNVSVPVTVNPDGGGEDSHSATLHVPGDYELAVGDDETVGEETVTVTGLLVRDDAVGYDRHKLDERGDAAQAKDIKRVYATVEGEDAAWSGW